METQPKRVIETSSRRIGVRIGGRLFERDRVHSWNVLDSRVLVKTLTGIRETTTEEHTKNNIQILIDQIVGMDLDA
jgi:hypothetical protein